MSRLIDAFTCILEISKIRSEFKSIACKIVAFCVYYIILKEHIAIS